MLFELPVGMYQQYNAHQGNGQSALLPAVKTSIECTYSTTSIKADGQVILVPFKDGITFEVVPAFLNDDNVSYTFPNANDGGSWKTTNPRPEIAAIVIATATATATSCKCAVWLAPGRTSGPCPSAAS
jgi:hypothetical protein